MNDRRGHATGATMRRWMTAVGTFYLVLGIGLLPWGNDARIGTPVPGGSRGTAVLEVG